MLITAVTVLSTACATRNPSVEAASPKWGLADTDLNRSAARLRNDTAEHLAWAKAFRARLIEADGPRTIDNTLVPYNEMMLHADAARNECELFARVHPDADIRAAAERGEQDVKQFLTGLKLDRDVFVAFSALDVSGADQPTRFVVEKVLRDFRRAGVNLDVDARERIAALNDEIVRIGQEFARNIRDDEREIVVGSAADLAGMPQDWIDKHLPGADGSIRITTRTPDYIPFMTYAHNADARKRLYVEFRNRGFPANIEVLDRLIARRYDLAQLLGYDDWADYVTEDKMIESAENAQTFIDRVSHVAHEPARREYETLLARKRQDDPDAAEAADWEKTYLEQLVKNEHYALDSQLLRGYFNFPDVLEGLFTITQRLFGVTYRQVHDLPLWHQDVTAWDVLEGDRLLGRFYLDLFPRENKYGHAAQFDYRTGVAGLRLPQAVLVCNFPNPREAAGGSALMEHDEVVTFFHEFGHLIHAILSGRQPWIGVSGITTEWDFVEAPSQMLEEWCFHPDSLRLFARHHQTRELIPFDLVDKLRRASEFGKGLQTAHQMYYAAVSLGFYNDDPEDLDTTRKMIELQDKYSAFDYVDGTHFQCSFGHLDEYSAIYYTYMWSLVIAKDLFSRFEENGMLDLETSMRYRRYILEPGGSKKAADLVQDFLGRPFSFDSFRAWLERT
jgi:thimet oligopeptidase